MRAGVTASAAARETMGPAWIDVGGASALKAPAPEANFSANPAERLEQAPLRLGSRSRWALGLIGAALLHVAFLSPLFFDGENRPDPATSEIPVDIIVEPPPPPPEAPPKPDQPKPDPPQAAQPLKDEIATDAPRAENKEKAEREAPDQRTTGPVPPAPTAQTSVAPALGEQAVGQSPTGAPEAAEASAEPAPDRPDAEVIRPPGADNQAEKPKETPAKERAAPQSLAKIIGEPFPTWSTGKEFPAFETTPDFKLGDAALPTPIAGGAAKSTYLSIVYGMIMSHMHAPPLSSASVARPEGVIVLHVDPIGNVTRRDLVRPSGVKALDRAALAAVTQAAPFPQPPQGFPLVLTFTYGEK